MEHLIGKLVRVKVIHCEDLVVTMTGTLVEDENGFYIINDGGRVNLDRIYRSQDCPILGGIPTIFYYI